MIQLDYKSKEIKNNYIMDPSDFPSEVPVYDLLILGDLHFVVDYTDFSIEDVYIPSFAVGLFMVLDYFKKHGEGGWFCILETPVNFVLEPVGEEMVKISYQKALPRSVVCSYQGLLDASIKLLHKVLVEIFKLHPVLLDHEGFLKSMPMGHEVVNEIKSDQIKVDRSMRPGNSV